MAFITGALGALVLMIHPRAHAVAIDWSGQYRVELVDIDHTEMKDGSHKSYLLNNLILQPHVYGSDGFEVVSRLHLTDDGTNQSQLGMRWGTPHSTTDATGAGANSWNQSDSVSQNRPKTGLYLSQIYLKADQEWGQLIFGRAPMHFGLGINHNSGQDGFAHWYDTRDTLAYSIHWDNVVMTPSISKNFVDDFALGRETTVKSFRLEYKNPDNGDWLGLLYENTVGPKSANDIPLGDTLSGGLDIKSYDLILGKSFGSFAFKVEGAVMDGASGKRDSNTNSDIKISNVAIVSELEFNKDTDPNQWKLKLGSVSGDNPSTANYEGFLLDRNYEVALLLFNHPLGDNADIFKTALGRESAGTPNANVADEEFISNVLFIAPQWRHQLAERWNMRNTLIYAGLSNNSVDIGGGNIEEIDSHVGLEWDLGFSYKANSNLEWKVDSGVVFPGKAFALGSANKSTSTVFGIVTAAAITF